MLKTSAETLRTAFAKTLPACARRNTIPILGMARITASDGVFKVSTTDLDMQIDVDGLGETKGELNFAVDLRQVLGLIRYLPRTEAVELSQDGDKDRHVYLTWQGGRAQLYTLPALDFPEFKTTGEPVTATITEDDFGQLRRLLPFISTEETRYYLTGVCLDAIDDRGAGVATDGHRLTVLPLSEDFGAAAKIANRPILPRTSVARMLGLRMADAEATFWKAKRTDEHGKEFDYVPHFEVQADGIRFRTKVIDGSYPDWKRVLPKEITTSIEVSRAYLIDALRIVVGFARDQRHPMISLIANNGRVQVQARSYEGAVALDIGPAPANLSVNIGINARYLQDALNTIRGATVILGQEGAEFDPIRLIGSEAVSGEHVVLMPLRAGQPRANFVAPFREAA